MKILKVLVVIFLFAFSGTIYGQNYVDTKKGLEVLEIKKSEFNKEKESGSFSAKDHEMAEIYFEILPVYFNEGYDVPFSLDVCFEKSLAKYDNEQEQVVDFFEMIKSWFVIE